MQEPKKLLNKIKEKIAITQEERENDRKLEERVSSAVRKLLKGKKKVRGFVIAGSLKRNTYLREKKDLDVFVLFSKSVSEKELEKKGLEIGRRLAKVLKARYEIDFGQHPYSILKLREYAIEVVPGYKIKKGEKIKSAVDRTVFHQEFLEKRIKGKEGEVRLLKQFLTRFDLYGARLRVEGFSGYLCELLILRYGSFWNLVKEAARWKEKEVIEFGRKKMVKNVEEIINKFKSSSLIFLDPVDRGRNVASALNRCNYEYFKTLCKRFVSGPRIDFFFKPKIKILEVRDVRKRVLGENLVVLKFPYRKTHEDVLYGQLKRFYRGLEKKMRRENYKIERKMVWSDEKKVVLLVLKMKGLRGEKLKWIKGPLLKDQKNLMGFMKKHREVFGKKIRQGHVYLKIRNPYENVLKIIEEKIREEKKRKSYLGNRLKNSRVFSKTEILKIYEGNIKEVLSRFLGRQIRPCL